MPRKWGRGEKLEKWKAHNRKVEINQRKSKGNLRSSVLPKPMGVCPRSKMTGVTFILI